MFGNYHKNSAAPGARGPGHDLKGGFSTTVAFMLALIFAPIVSSHTLPFVLEIARKSYAEEIVAIFEVVWMICCFPFVFFAAREGVAYALTAAGVYLAYRLI